MSKDDNIHSEPAECYHIGWCEKNQRFEVFAITTKGDDYIPIDSSINFAELIAQYPMCTC